MTPEDVLKQYESRINLHRFEQVAPLISDEAIFWFSDGSHTGLEEIREAFERNWRSVENEHYWLDDLEWIARGVNSASCVYRFNWKGVADGRQCSGSGRGTTVLRKEPGGWKIIHEHLSPLPR